MRAPKGESKEFEKHPAGYTTGVCTRVIDKGTHWNEKKQTFQRKIMLGFESDKLMQEGEFKGEPFLLFANFNYSMYQNAHLCGFIEDWEARKFHSQDEADAYDLSKLIGKPAFMNIIHSDDGKWTNIQTIGPVPEGMTAPAIKGKTIVVDQDALDKAEVDKLSDKMKETIMSAKERTEGEQYEAGERITANTATPNTEEGDPGVQSEDDFNDRIPF